jgi:pimeloyl-ACP methyl ester carboxylesterase
MKPALDERTQKRNTAREAEDCAGGGTDVITEKHLSVLGFSVFVHRAARSRLDDAPGRWVLLLGWAFAPSRAVLKYTSLLTDQGYSVITCITGSAVMRPGGQVRELTRAIVQLVQQEAGDGPLFLLGFSNGAGLLFQQMLLLADADDSGKSGARELMHGRIRGCAFDSCPGELSLRTGLRAFLAGRPSGGRLNIDMACLGGAALATLPLTWSVSCIAVAALAALPLQWAASGVGLAWFFAAGRGFWWLWRQLSLGLPSAFAATAAVLVLLSVGQRRKNTQYQACFASLSVPTLFLFSEDDQLCEARHTERAAELRKERGFPVETKKWTKSGHVAHLRHHPDEYKQTLLTFMNKHFTGQ